ncbi:aminopeptidase P family protein [Solitalea koreensis]|uniref:Xaa-Pro aminopeptidase n=1 Tax=Solitalea koreensis TaxID=543615 RepID=A0A521C3B3_9SPHI|nr:aminopeptidase P family protein [Solitalea koreensis]SMO53888.1 Xaa-Pro aminopeptidase [Solitalea koreensis]
MTSLEKIAAIRSQMSKQGVDAYIIPSSDPHLSEYLPAYYKSIAWVSGFSGSAGTLVITNDFAGLWTDARYFVQAEEQLKNSGFELMKLKVQNTPEFIEWLQETLKPGAKVAVDGNITQLDLVRFLQSGLRTANIELVTEADYISSIWTDRPALSKESAFLLSKEMCGESTAEKLQRVAVVMKKKGANTHVLSTLDDIAWAFNLRGSDVTFNPVVLSYGLITDDGKAKLYIDQSKLSPMQVEELSAQGVEVKGYNAIKADLAALPENSVLLIDPKRTCFALYKAVPSSVKVVEELNPSTQFKALKNPTEIAATRKAMVKDGVALVRFFNWLETALNTETITELAVVDKLHAFRAEQKNLIGDSFDTIAAYNAHAALPHYKPTNESNVELKKQGIFLLDSGGQYLDGTTDITRVIPLGQPTDQQKIDYTLVLQGMIDLSMTRFPEGTKGYQLDAIARKNLWEHGFNYGHGTGHGVGFFLNVHEGPQVINGVGANTTPLQAGMITSNEPGIYRLGHYGIRIENLVLCVEDKDYGFGKFMKFETLTLCPIDCRLIKADMLTDAQEAWLNQYHLEVYKQLSPYLEGSDLAWLKKHTQETA